MRVLAFVVAVSFVVLSPLIADAQSLLPTQLVNLSTTQVKPDMVAEYEALLKEYRDALEEAGVLDYFVYRVARGETNEYISTVPVNAFADFDGPNPAFQVMGEVGAAQWRARMTKTTLGRRVETLRLLGDLAIPRQRDEPLVAVLRAHHNLPGLRGAYTEWLRNRYVPALRDAGIDGVFQLENAFGGRRWYELRVMDNWAVFDSGNPLQEHLGAEAFGDLMSSGGRTTDSPEIKVLIRRSELSIR